MPPARALVLAALVAIGLLGVARGANAGATAAPPWERLESTAREFVAALASNHVARAYGLLSRKTARSRTLEAFTAQTAPYRGPLGRFLDIDFQKPRLVSNDCAHLVSLARYEYAVVRIKLDFCPQGKEWRIGSLEAEAVSAVREPIVRAVILGFLEKHRIPAPRSFKCPDIAKARTGQLVSCRLEYTSDCTITARVKVAAGFGFRIIDTDAPEACDTVFSQAARP